MLKRIIPFVVLLVLCVPASILRSSVYADSPTYKRVSLGCCAWVYALDINESGQIVGYTAANQWGPDHAVLWDDGVMIPLGTLTADASYPYDQSYAIAINNGGQIVGFSLSLDYTWHAVMWEHGGIVDLGTDWWPSDINDFGQVLGVSSGGRQALIWQNGGIVEITGCLEPSCHVNSINNLGQVVGTRYLDASGYNRQAFVWTNGTMTNLENLTDGDGASSTAGAINDGGQVAGLSRASDGTYHAVLWNDGTVVDLGTGFGPRAMNNRGQIVGSGTWGRWPSELSGTYHAFLWDKGTLTDLGTGFSVNGVTLGLSSATAINNRGDIVGQTRPWWDSDEAAVLWTRK